MSYNIESVVLLVFCCDDDVYLIGITYWHDNGVPISAL